MFSSQYIIRFIRPFSHSRKFSRAQDTLEIIREILATSSEFSGSRDRSLKSAMLLKKRTNFVTKLPEDVMFMWLTSLRTSRLDVADGDADFAERQALSISFPYRIPSTELYTVIALFRSPEEPFSHTCGKIREKIQKLVAKQRPTLATTDSCVNPLVISAANKTVNWLLSSNAEVYKNKNIAEIMIDDHRYKVVRDPPRCTNLCVKLKPYVGCPLIASVALADVEKNNVSPIFHWYTGDDDALLRKPEANTKISDDSLKSPKYLLHGWLYRCTGFAFCPTLEDLGKRVAVVLDLGNDAVVYCSATDGLVAEIDEPLIYENRQASHCSQRTVHSLRIMSYNVLADLYLDLKNTQEKLYFPYCEKQYQECTYRYPLLLKELPGYNADLLFVQEVDERLWVRYLPEFMELHGYTCLFKRKGLKVNEGLVTCYRTSMFRLIRSENMWLADLLDNNQYPENGDIVDLLNEDKHIHSLFTSRPTVVQASILSDQSDDPKVIYLLANTHLHFDPRHELIKVLQALLCARWISRIAYHCSKSYARARLHIFFAGDFNSTPGSSVCQLLSAGRLSLNEFGIGSCSKKHDFLSFQISCEQSEQYNLKLKSLIENDQITNFTRHYRYDGSLSGFEGCLDYIWASSDVEVRKIIPMPSEELIKKYVALPSKICPSDHLPLICDVQLS